MYCPKCSQQQVSDEMRFCSRCGFSLTAVRELIDSDSALVEQVAEVQAGRPSRSLRGIRKGAWMMLASLVLALVVLTAVEDEFAVLLVLPVLCFVIGFVRLLYGVFFAEKRIPPIKGTASQPHSIIPGQLGTPTRNPQLSPPRVAPIESFTAHRIETAEMVQPRSVTENTTRLLDEESNPRRG
ncbi:MAG: hypothetical protein ABR568_03965 [Pyrinomonadaceae bacterium]